MNEPRRLSIERVNGAQERLPPLHWKECHPATRVRFKATMSCHNGHEFVLRGHAVNADGLVSPSVVCPVEGCTFHEYVTLNEWPFGLLAQDPRL